jgi:predicted AAA+ superfamily ATPase
MKNRKLFFEISDYLKVPEIIVITGMRRVGKSSLLKMIFDSIDGKNKILFDIDNPLDRALFEEKDFNNIIHNLADLGLDKKERMYLFLDEIQSFPEIVKALKYLYDHYEIKIIVTGSSSFYLKNLFPESLSGRKIEFELYPLDFDEFLYFKGISGLTKDKDKGTFKKKSEIIYQKLIKHYDEYLNYGGFPQVVLAEGSELKKKYLRDIFRSYFQTDLLQLSNIRNISHLRDLIILLASRIGNKIDVSRLSSELGINRETVYNYLAFLSGSYFFHFINRYGKNQGKEVSSTRKVYICDNGIANEIAKLTEGQNLENAVFLNIRKYGTLQYYHDKEQKEIDFILPDSGYAIEVKRTAIEKDVRSLKSFAGRIGIINSVVISYNYSAIDGVVEACGV